MVEKTKKGPAKQIQTSNFEADSFDTVSIHRRKNKPEGRTCRSRTTAEHDYEIAPEHKKIKSN